MTAVDRPGQAAAACDGDISGTARSTGRAEDRLIDQWFPCAAVDETVGTPAGSGRSEKALFTWFASRPVAQARAAVLTTLLPNDDTLRGYVNHAIRGQRGAFDRLAEIVKRNHPGAPPVVLDMFSGRGIIPLEAARIGATAVGIDLSPVATLGGRLLADYTFRDWSGEPSLPFKDGAPAGSASASAEVSSEARLGSPYLTGVLQVAAPHPDRPDRHRERPEARAGR